MKAYFLENVPMISNPLPFSLGNQSCLGGEYDTGVGVNPNISPSKPVLEVEAAGKSEVFNNESNPEASKSTEGG